jgi:hypothetical protein
VPDGRVTVFIVAAPGTETRSLADSLSASSHLTVATVGSGSLTSLANSVSGGRFVFLAGIENSTISGNTADNGGGIFAIGGSLSLTQSTISGNTSNQDGGGILSLTAKYETTTIDNSTIAQNAAANSGGGIYLAQYGSGDQSGTAAINSTIVADNTAGGESNDLFLQTTSTGGGFNNTFSLIENPGNAPLLGSQALITGVDPQLGPLADNGGPTQTMLPSNTSPVIDQGNAQAGLTTDQRGEPRTVDNGKPEPQGGDGTDIGAVELPLIPPTPPPPPPTPPVVAKPPVVPKPRVVVTTQCKSRRHSPSGSRNAPGDSSAPPRCSCTAAASPSCDGAPTTASSPSSTCAAYPRTPTASSSGHGSATATAPAGSGPTAPASDRAQRRTTSKTRAPSSAGRTDRAGPSAAVRSLSTTVAMCACAPGGVPLA